MLKAFDEGAGRWPDAQKHVEYFKPREIAGAPLESFSVVIKSSGRRFEIPTGRSILDVLTENGVICQSSCRDGVCGTCETGVLEGVPDHRDSVLSTTERASNTTMMICVSRALGGNLVLDL
jgi:ferredoxin